MTCRRPLAVAWLLSLVALPALAGCVVPVPGGPLFEKESTAAPFRVRVERPGVERPTTSGGSLDGVAPGAAAVLVGWAPADDVELVVVTEQPAHVLSSRRTVRPDVAAAVGRSDAELGFRLLLRAVSGSVDRACVLARTRDGAVALLPGSDAGLCPEVPAA